MPDAGADATPIAFGDFSPRLSGGRPHRRARAARSVFGQALRAVLHDQARRRRGAGFRCDQAAEIRHGVSSRQLLLLRTVSAFCGRCITLRSQARSDLDRSSATLRSELRPRASSGVCRYSAASSGGASTEQILCRYRPVRQALAADPASVSANAGRRGPVFLQPGPLFSPTTEVTHDAFPNRRAGRRAGDACRGEGASAPVSMRARRLIAGLIRAAREDVERATGMALIDQTWRLVLDRWPSSGVRC